MQKLRRNSDFTFLFFSFSNYFLCIFRYNAKRASLVQSRIKQLEKLPELKPVEKEAEVVLKFPEVEKLAGSILTLSEVAYKYPGQTKTTFSNVDLSATMESRICIVSAF